MQDLSDPIARVRAAKGADRELDARLWCWDNDCDFIKIAKEGDRYGDLCDPGDRGYGWPNTVVPGHMVYRHRTPQDRGNQVQCYGDHSPGFTRYTASLDAALALVERVLPKTVMLLHLREDAEATFWPVEESFVRATAPTAPLAVILALLMALEEKA